MARRRLITKRMPTLLRQLHHGPSRRFVSRCQRFTIHTVIPVRADSILTLDIEFVGANLVVMDHATATYDMVRNAQLT